MVESGGDFVVIFVLKFASNLKLGIALEFFYFLFALDDEAERWRLDAPSGDSTRDFATDNARKVITD